LEQYVVIDPRYYRPSEVGDLVADASKAEQRLGWKAKTALPALVHLMVDHELKQHGLIS
jgi:GDPmannose 4,6-dehydratase